MNLSRSPPNAESRWTQYQPTATAITSLYPPTWPPSAKALRTHGLYRPGNLCYQRESLKALLHIPRALSWIQQHGSRRTPCLYTPVADVIKCPACAIKAFARLYWSAPAVPASLLRKALEGVDAALTRNWDLATTWPHGPRDQGDAADFLQTVLEAIAESSESAVWRLEKEAMFTVKVGNTDTCKICGHASVSQPEYCTVLRLDVKRQGNDSNEEAFRRTYADVQLTKNCKHCDGNSEHRRSQQIENMPAVLLVQFNIMVMDHYGQTTKLQTKIKFGEVLDISPHLADKSVPGKYSLQTVTAHGGRDNAGHYVGALRSPAGVFVSNDDDTKKIAKKELTKSLVWIKKQPYNPYLLAYVLDPLVGN